MGVFAYYDADTDGTVYHVMPSSESEYAESTLYSETDSTLSGATIQSDDLPGYFIIHHGRPQSANENVPKWFPSDNIRRYIVRYLVIKSMLRGEYIGPVKEILTPIDGRQPQALELGTRTGTWVQAMAAEFPHVQFRTIDVVPMIPHVPLPNVVFEVYDFAEGLLLEDESQDAVFMNVVLELVRDYRALLREVYRVLRPGGLIYVVDYNPNFWDPEDSTIPAWRTNPHGHRFCSLVRQSISNLGIDPDTSDKLPQWLASGSDLWSRGESGFTSIQAIIRTYPMYPHDGFPCMEQIDPEIAPLIRYLGVVSLRDMSSLLQDVGLASGEAETLIDNALGELEQPERCPLFKMCCTYAIKI